MINVFGATNPKSKMRRSVAPRPKYRVGQLVVLRLQFEDGELLIERGIVQVD